MFGISIIESLFYKFVFVPINLISIFETATGVNSHYLCKSLLKKQVSFFFIIYQYRSLSLSITFKLDKVYQHIFHY